MALPHVRFPVTPAAFAPLPGVAVPASKRALLVVSHAQERAFAAHCQQPVPGSRSGEADLAGPGLVLALFQQREYFDEEARRYAALARAGHTVVVGFVGAGDRLPPGVVAVTFAQDDPRAQEWVLVLVADSLATGLVAVDRGDLSLAEATLQAGRLFDARWTFERATALATARTQLARLAETSCPRPCCATRSRTSSAAPRSRSRPSRRVSRRPRTTS